MTPEDALLFELPEPSREPPNKELKTLKYPVWTGSKAKLIQRYLYYFVFITRHGTYLDGFAGPQDSRHPDTWAAKLVLESEPRWLRHFHLFELKPRKVRALQELAASQPEQKNRTIVVYEGDFNARVHEVLGTRPIGDNEATFCLLDQRTFECHWSTVEALARYRAGGLKLELFYFMPQSWLSRAMHAIKDDMILRAWWGRDDYRNLLELSSHERAALVSRRFMDELGYKEAKPWPIFKSLKERRVMYHMVHATDHPDASALMWRAYHHAVDPLEPMKQLELELVAWGTPSVGNES